MTNYKSRNSKPGLSRNRKLAIAAVGILAVAGGVWGVAGRSKDKKPDVPKELTVAALKAQAGDDPGIVFRQVQQAMSRPDLTDTQRHAIVENVRTVFKAEMDKRINTYFAAANDSERKAILDRDIDRMQARMKEFEQHRAQYQRESTNQPRNPQSPRGPGGPNAGPPGGPGGQRHDGSHRPGGATRQERKAYFESMNPDQRARGHAYWAARVQRAKERGIQMPSGGPH